MKCLTRPGTRIIFSKSILGWFISGLESNIPTKVAYRDKLKKRKKTKNLS
jgi:hypothetical protein